MERSIADGHPDLARVGGHHPLHEWIETAAGVARGIEELNDVDLRVRRSLGRRIGAHEKRLPRERLRRVGLPALVDERADDERRHEYDRRGDEERFSVHFGTL